MVRPYFILLLPIFKIYKYAMKGFRLAQELHMKRS